MTQYIYDAEGNRIAKGGGSFACVTSSTTPSTFSQQTWFILDGAGQEMTEMDYGSGQWQWAHSDVFAGSKLLATYCATGTPYCDTSTPTIFALSDWLGTKRVQATAAGTIDTLGSSPAVFPSLPYGDQAPQPPLGASEHFFTGKERDTESGDDYFDARYFSSAAERFLSADWAAKEEPVPYAHFDDPQSLNLYSYVRNNPLSRTDPDGHCGPSDIYGCVEIIQAVGNFFYHALQQQAQSIDAMAADPSGRGQAILAVNGALLSTAPLAGAGAIEETGVRTDVGEGNALATGAAAEAEGAAATPSEAYNRRAHYGDTPTAADKNAVGGESVDHDPPLVKRYYEGDATKGEKPGFQQTPSERKASATDRARMRPSTKAAQRSQGGHMSNYSKEQKKKYGLN